MGRAVLERSGNAQEVLERGVEILEAGNEDPSGFRVTHRYIVATATRAGGPATATGGGTSAIAIRG